MMQDNTIEEEWTTVSYKKKTTKYNSKGTFNSKKSKKINKDFDKTKVKLWYDNSSWQHNVLTNNYEYEDGTNVLSKFNISNLFDEYNKAESNYDKNNIVRNLTKVINDEKWKEEQMNVRIINKIVEVAEKKQEIEKQNDEAIETSDNVDKQTDVVESNEVCIPKYTRKYDNSISFAEMIKRS
tara:strand:- start:1838 stop:2383 length:546 start_codon:yes stop_codon:yes gene_type:complete